MSTDNPVPDPLRELLGESSASVNREKLARIVKPYISIDGQTGDFGFLSDFRALKNVDRMEVILAAVKARSLLIEGFADGVSPSSIIALEAMPIGSVKSSLKGLSDSHRVKQNKDGTYFLPNYRLDELSESLGK